MDKHIETHFAPKTYPNVTGIDASGNGRNGVRVFIAESGDVRLQIRSEVAKVNGNSGNRKPALMSVALSASEATRIAAALLAAVEAAE